MARWFKVSDKWYEIRGKRDKHHTEHVCMAQKASAGWSLVCTSSGPLAHGLHCRRKRLRKAEALLLGGQYVKGKHIRCDRD